MPYTKYILSLFLFCTLNAWAQKQVLHNEVMRSEQVCRHGLVFNEKVVFDDYERQAELLEDSIYLQYDRLNSHSFISNSQDYFSSFQAVWISDYFARLAIIPGTYDIITDMRNATYDYHILIFEEVDLEDGDTLVFSISEAQHEILLEGVDEEGVDFGELPGSSGKYFSFVFPENSQLISSSYSVPQYKNIHTNTFTERFLLYTSNLYYDLYDENKINLALFDPLYGVNSNITHNFEPSNYYHKQIRLDYREGGNNPKLGIFHVRELLLNGVWYLSKAGSQKELSQSSWEGQFYVSPAQVENYAHAWLPGIFIESATYPYYFGQPYDVFNDSVREGYGTQLPNWVMQSGGGIYNVGKGAVIPEFLFDNQGLSGNQARIYFGANTNYFGIHNEERREDQLFASYNILDETGSIIDSGTLGDFEDLLAENGRHSFQVINDHYDVGGRSGRAEYQAEFEVGMEDSNPPSLFCFQSLGVDGLPYDVLRKDEDASLLFAASDYYWLNENEHWYPLRLKELLIDSTGLFIKHENDAEWTTMNPEYFYQDSINGSYFRAELDEFTYSDTGFYDVRIRICDLSMNKVDYTLSPAFGVKDEFVGLPDNSSGYSVDLFDCYPNPFNDEININILKKNPQQSIINIYNSQGELVDASKTSSTEYCWKPEMHLPHEVYFIEVKSGEKSMIKKIIRLNR
ncbi:MAG: T9SS type A sorting domain-containing protein [Bacteroidota bacterium]|nr:T9SS type A sorting domain-containing protein [Bacteroidota bacterium]